MSIEIAYYSKAGNTEAFARRVYERVCELEPEETVVMDKIETGKKREGLLRPGVGMCSRKPIEKIILITPTYGSFDHTLSKTSNFTPQAVLDFVNLNLKFVTQAYPFVKTGVLVGGNRTFGHDFAVAARETGLKRLGTFELRGTPEDVEEAAQAIVNL